MIHARGKCEQYFDTDSEELGVSEKTTVTCTLNKQDVRICTGFSWLG
jgi:hypothetical protein